MKPYFGTTSDIAMLSCAGSGGLEAAVVNTLSPGDRVLGVSIGSFGDRFAKIAKIYGADVTKVEVEWGQAAAADDVREALRAAPGPKAVLLTHNETSTGVMNPIADLAAAIREDAPDALILVDSVSGLGAVPFEMDAWGVDVVVTGSQKAWMAAPGPGDGRRLAARLGGDGDGDDAALLPRPASPSRQPRQRPDAVDAGDRRRLPGRRGPAAHGRRRARTPSSPATRPARRRRGPASRRSASSCSPTRPSPRAPSPRRSVPDDLDWKAFNSEVKRRGVVLAGGQGKLTGKIFRLGHLGSVTARGDPRRDEHARDGLASRPAGRSRPGPPSRRPRSRRSTSYGLTAPAGALAGA